VAGAPLLHWQLLLPLAIVQGKEGGPGLLLQGGRRLGGLGHYTHLLELA